MKDARSKSAKLHDTAIRHGHSAIDFLLLVVGVGLLIYGGMMQGAELLMFKWVQVAASQLAAHMLVLFLFGLHFEFRSAEQVDKLCVIALRLGFAYCFSVGG